MKKGLLILHVFVFALLIYDIYIWIRYDSSFSGYWTDRIIFWLWFVTAIIIIYSQWDKDIYSKIYLYCIIGLIILTMVPMMVPCVFILSKVTGTDRDFTVELTPSLRLDEVSKGPMSLPEAVLIEQNGLFEYGIASLNYYDWGVKIKEQPHRLKELDSIQLIKMSDDSITFKFIKDDQFLILTSAK